MTGHAYAPGLDDTGFVEVCQVCGQPEGSCVDPAYDPGPVPLDGIGAELLDELHAALTRYVVLPAAEAADAIVLWIAATHAVQAWNCAPRLDVTSPVKRCGKSRLLDVIEATCHDPLITVNISPAALVRSIGDDPPTLLLDEADTVFGPKAADNHEDLRGIINAGHSRNRPYIRWDVTTRGPEHCPTFAMAALAGIGDLPDTITDRAVVVAMRRRAPGETVSRFRDRRDGAPLKALGKRLGAWVRSHLDELRDAEPDMPVEDRAADTWEPLIAIGDLAGNDWPARARKAALALTAEDGDDPSLGDRLLGDLRDIFGDADALHTETILTALAKLDEAPWGDFPVKGRPSGRAMNAGNLADLLRPYKVKSCDVKLGGVNRKGYRRDHLHDPWTRYLPEPPGGSATSATSATAQVNDGDQVAGSGSEGLPATSGIPLTSQVAEVAEVADTPQAAAIRTGTCEVCGELMAIVEDGQRYHPNCQPGGTARRPLLLDLFSGAGGCSAGYHRAGFDVIGIDSSPMPRYPFEFHQMDWRDALEMYGPAADVLAASPPCQDYSASRALGSGNHPRLIAEVRAAFEATGKPWVIENVVGSDLASQATLDGAEGITLCGAMFGLRTYRHRLFESSIPLDAPHHPRHDWPQAKMGRPVKPGEFMSVVGHFSDIATAREAMGIGWMTGPEMAQAIPPAYTEWVGSRLLALIGPHSGA